MPDSSFEVRGFVMEDPISGEETYAIAIQVRCPYCGDQVYTIAGHHLRSFRDALVQMIDARPDLCGPKTTTKGETITIEGTTNNPEEN